MRSLLISAIYMFANVLTTLLLLRAILSWFLGGPYGTIHRIYGKLCVITEPLVMPFRSLAMRIGGGMFDFSVFFAIIAVNIVTKIVVKLLWMVMF